LAPRAESKSGRINMIVYEMRTYFVERLRGEVPSTGRVPGGQAADHRIPEESQASTKRGERRG
jgi:hypothetical protein